MRKQVKDQKQVKDGAQETIIIHRTKINSKAFAIPILTVAGL